MQVWTGLSAVFHWRLDIRPPVSGQETLVCSAYGSPDPSLSRSQLQHCYELEVDAELVTCQITTSALQHLLFQTTEHWWSLSGKFKEFSSHGVKYWRDWRGHYRPFQLPLCGLIHWLAPQALLIILTESCCEIFDAESRLRWPKGLFIWSRVAEATLSPSYPVRNIFPLICSKNDINRLHEAGETTWEGETTRGGELSCLGRYGSPGRRDNIFACKRFSLSTRDEAHAFFTAMRFCFALQTPLSSITCDNYGGPQLSRQ